MTRHGLYLALMTALTSRSFAATAGELKMYEALPELRGEYLTGRKAILPNDASGRVALLLFGFTYQSRFEVEAWAKRFRQDFDADPTVTFYEIPMIGGMARLGKWFIDGGMRRGTPQADRENVITVYGGTDPWKQRLQVKVEDAAYLVVIDRTGKVAWRYTGSLEESAYQALAAQVRKLAFVE